MQKAEVLFATRLVAGHGATGEERTWTAQMLPVRSVDEEEFAALPPPGEYRFAIRARNGADRSLAPALARKPVTVK